MTSAYDRVIVCGRDRCPILLDPDRRSGCCRLESVTSANEVVIVCGRIRDYWTLAVAVAVVDDSLVLLGMTE